MEEVIFSRVSKYQASYQAPTTGKQDINDAEQAISKARIARNFHRQRSTNNTTDPQ